MTHRPSAARTQRNGTTERIPGGARTVVALVALVTLTLAVITVTTVHGERGQAVGQGSHGAEQHPPPPANGGGGHKGSPGSAASAPTAVSRARQADRQREAHKVFELAEHPLLADSGTGLEPHGCDLPEWRPDRSAVKKFFTAARQCLDHAWGPVLRAHNLPFKPPELHFPTGSSFRTDCGTIEIGVATAAYYCENNLYVPFEGLQTRQYGQSPGIYLALFAHEYGHHVQEVSGIMDAAWQRIYRAGRSSAAGLEMSRRKELQAQCFSGMFMSSHVGRGGSITQRMFSRAWADQASRGDDHSDTRNHGSNAHYARWWRIGARTNSLSACNTFAAPDSAVS